MSPQARDFYFFSDMLGRRLVSQEGRMLGRVSDIVAEKIDPYPTVAGLIVRRGLKGAPAFFPWSGVVDLGPPLVVAAGRPDVMDTPDTASTFVHLRAQILDKQIVDTFGAKVVRVNDLQFLRIDSQLRLVHVDVGFRGLMRRVGWEKWLCASLRWLFAYDLPDHLIAWKHVQLPWAPAPLHLTVSQKKLSDLHPAELADILEDLSGRDRSRIFHALDTETAANALEEIDDPKVQKALIETVSVEKASDIIEEMSPNEAVDLLADLPLETADDILDEMNEEKAEDLRELLVHPAETAGGIMTTSFLSLPPEITAETALNRLKAEAPDLDILYYVYLLDRDGVLCGVVSLRDLLTAAPQRPLSEIGTTRLITVTLQAKPDDVVDLFVKYGFRALPVVDESDHLKGAIRLRAALEILAQGQG
jgi:CBS domain-containing protein/sporulation protein YlmC with PRC-barrel domain